MAFEIERHKGGWMYREPARLGKLAVRIDIFSAPNVDQSYARISVWSANTLSWNEVWSLMSSTMLTVTAKDTAPTADNFAKDADDLFQTAKKIIGEV